MDSIKITDDEINVEDIMRKIKENMMKKKDTDNVSMQTAPAIEETFQVPPEAKEMKQDLDYINLNWNVHADYNISSHRPVVGRLLIWGRQAVHDEVRRYIDTIIGKQEEFNSHVARLFKGNFNFFNTKIDEAINSINKDIDGKTGEINRNIDGINRNMNGISKNVDGISKNIDGINRNIDGISRSLDSKVNETVASVNNDLKNKAWLSGLLDERIKRNLYKATPASKHEEIMNYFLFEEKYRGSTEDIKKRQTIFLKYFKDCQKVLDIGCGRGEFLSLLKENDVGAKGIDLDEDMVLFCRKNGLDVEQVEALSFLMKLEDKSLDGVFSGQVIEHLQPTNLIQLVKICYDKMKYGTYFIAETINPLCLSVFAKSFYMDMTHVKPVHPATIKFLMESAGFREIELKFFSPHSDEAKLDKIEINNELDENSRRRLELMNKNVDKLNELLYGYQDYAIIGKK